MGDSSPGVSLCSPLMACGDTGFAGLSVCDLRLHLCGEGVAVAPASGLHLRRFGDWGPKRASNSMERFNVAPHAMFLPEWIKSRPNFGGFKIPNVQWKLRFPLSLSTRRSLRKLSLLAQRLAPPPTHTGLDLPIANVVAKCCCVTMPDCTMSPTEGCFTSSITRFLS